MNRSWKKDGQMRHASNLMPSHKKTTRTIRRDNNAYGTKDLGASSSIRQGGCVVLLCVVCCVLCVVSLRTAETEQVHQAKRMIGGIGNMLFSIYSQT